MAIVGIDIGSKSLYASNNMLEMYSDNTLISSTESFEVSVFSTNNILGISSKSSYSSNDMLEMYSDNTLISSSEGYEVSTFSTTMYGNALFTTTTTSNVVSGTTSKQMWFG